MGLPDFFIIGAMKCGTSTLQAQLAAQVGIFMTQPKEPNFFSDDAIYARGLAWYEQLFEGASPSDLKGEASTHYTKLPTFPETVPRLRAMIETPRLIYVIRDPVARSVSQHLHEWTQGTISVGLDAAFDKHPELVAYSRYADQIAPWVAAFGNDAILVLTLEEMIESPQRVLDRVGAFLGHQGSLVWQADKARVNVSVGRIRRIPMHELLVDNPTATAIRRALVPKALRNRIRAARQVNERPTLSPERRQMLERIFAEDYEALATLFPNAFGLASAYPFLKR